MSWISLILLILTNGPSVIRLIIEIRGLLKDLKGSEKNAVMEMCREDLLAFKKDKDKDKLLNAIRKKKMKRMNENGSV